MLSVSAALWFSHNSGVAYSFVPGSHLSCLVNIIHYDQNTVPSQDILIVYDI